MGPSITGPVNYGHSSECDPGDKGGVKRSGGGQQQDRAGMAAVRSWPERGQPRIRIDMLPPKGGQCVSQGDSLGLRRVKFVACGSAIPNMRKGTESGVAKFCRDSWAPIE